MHWAVPSALVWLMYASMVLALGVFAYGFWRRFRVWRLGRPHPVHDAPGLRARRVGAGLAQVLVLRRTLPGVVHVLLVVGFVVLFAATVVVFLDADLGLDVNRGDFYLGFESLTVDLFGALFLVGVAIAAYRRYVLRPWYLSRVEPRDALLLVPLFLIAVTGFALEGIRIAATDDPWDRWSPVGMAASAVVGWVGRGGYPYVWAVHMLGWHVFLATIPFSKAQHWFTTPANLFFARPRPPRGVPTPTDFEADDVRLGIARVTDLTWKQLFDLDACTECGRCTSVCPAAAAGKPLSPMRVILDLRDAIRAGGADTEHLAGGVVSAEALWACTTCRACEDICPAGVEHVPTIVGLRQNLAMEQVVVPDGVAETVKALEAREHPFRGSSFSRVDWLEGLDVPEVTSPDEAGGFDVVYWIGCAASFDERAQQIARSVVRVLRHAGVRLAVVAPRERCSGDVARRTGNEFHYDLLARANVEMLDEAGATRIVTHCPHCLQQLRHEYRQFGGRYEVVHHTELVATLIEQGRVKLSRATGERVAYHDPCYLGRYNGQYDAPRIVLDALAVERVEMLRSRRDSFCCGAGGGHAFYDDADGGEKINVIRAREAAATGASTIATGCPFCLTMLASGARAAVPAGEAAPRTRDVVELLAEAIVDDEGEPTPIAP